MTLNVWVTRPDSYEVLMGGMRHVQVWMSRPVYSHLPQVHEFRGREAYRDLGWTTWAGSVRAKQLLEQDGDLLDQVWRQIVLSCAPSGYSMPDALAFLDRDRGACAEDGALVPAWTDLKDEADWEAKCNTCFKRFLLQVDLRSNTVERIAPLVQLRRVSAEPSEFTDRITPTLALERDHPVDSPDRLPF